MSLAPRRCAERRLTQAIRIALLGMAIATGTGHAALAAEASPLDRVAVKHYDIPAGPLGRTLSSFAVRAGIALSFEPALTDGLNSAPVSGDLAARDVATRLLSGSGLEMVARPDGSFTLRKLPPRTSVDAGEPLPPVTVTATQESAQGPVRGYVAKLSATGTKTDTAIVEIPQTISVVTADQIRAQQPTSLVDALAYTAGVVRTEGSDHTTDSFVIRGFQAGANYGSLYRDGSKFMVNSYDGQQELYGLERVEVLKGAASLLYGTAAPGGVINTVSKRPTTEPLHEIGVQVGSYNEREVKGDFGGAIDEQGVWSYRLTGLARDSDTFIHYVPDDRQFLSAALKWQPDAATSVTLQADYLHSRTNYSYGLPEQGTILPNVNGRIASSFYNGLPGYDKYDGKNTSFGYLVEHAFSSELTLRHSAHAFRSDVNMPNSYGEGLSADQTSTTDRGAQDRRDFSKAYTSDTSVEYKVDTGRVSHTLLAGMDTTYQLHTTRRYNRDVSEQLNYFNPDYSYTLGAPEAFTWYPDTSTQDTGLYLQDQAKIDQRWVVVLGARHDRAAESLRPLDGSASSKERTSANTGRAGLVYLADNGLAPFVSFSQSFEPQSGVDRQGARFKPTKGEQYEVGVRYQPKGSATMLTATVYQLTQQNVLATDPVDTNFQVQTGEIRSRGVELEAKTSFGKSISLIAAYAYTAAIVTADTDPANVGTRRGAVPYNTVSAWGEYDFAALGLPGLKAGLGVRYVGPTLGLFIAGTVPAYTVADAVLSYSTGAWRYALNANNLTDKTYIASCTYDCFYGERRKVMASATYRW